MRHQLNLKTNSTLFLNLRLYLHALKIFSVVYYYAWQGWAQKSNKKY